MCFKCNNKNDCIGLAIVFSIIIGIITGFLRFNVVLAITPAFLWVVFSIAVALLTITYILSSSSAKFSVEGSINTTAFLSGVIGTILTSLLILAVDFGGTSISAAVFAGALLFFFTLAITSLACFIKNQILYK